MSIRMYASIRMDRPIDPEKHYISPGGYELIFDSQLPQSIEIEAYHYPVVQTIIQSPTSLECCIAN